LGRLFSKSHEGRPGFSGRPSSVPVFLASFLLRLRPTGCEAPFPSSLPQRSHGYASGSASVQRNLSPRVPEPRDGTCRGTRALSGGSARGFVRPTKTAFRLSHLGFRLSYQTRCLAVPLSPGRLVTRSGSPCGPAAVKVRRIESRSVAFSPERIVTVLAGLSPPSGCGREAPNLCRGARPARSHMEAKSAVQERRFAACKAALIRGPKEPSY